MHCQGQVLVDPLPWPFHHRQPKKASEQPTEIKWGQRLQGWPVQLHLHPHPLHHRVSQLRNVWSIENKGEIFFFTQAGGGKRCVYFGHPTKWSKCAWCNSQKRIHWISWNSHNLKRELCLECLWKRKFCFKVVLNDLTDHFFCLVQLCLVHVGLTGVTLIPDYENRNNCNDHTIQEFQLQYDETWNKWDVTVQIFHDIFLNFLVVLHIPLMTYNARCESMLKINHTICA